MVELRVVVEGPSGTLGTPILAIKEALETIGFVVRVEDHYPMPEKRARSGIAQRAFEGVHVVIESNHRVWEEMRRTNMNRNNTQEFDLLDLMSKEVAKSLRERVRQAAIPQRRDVPRSLQDGLMDAIEPLIIELAELKTSMRYSRLDGFDPIDIFPVPGTGPILSCEMQNGDIVVTRRSHGEKVMAWRAGRGGWEMKPMAE